MHGPHDLGGRDGIGTIPEKFKDKNQPSFRFDFERRIHGLTVVAMSRGAFNLDEHRHGIEKMQWSYYLESNYYEHWLYAVEALLEEKGTVTRSELEERIKVLEGNEDRKPSDPSAPQNELTRHALDMVRNGTPHDLKYTAPPHFRPGDSVAVRNINAKTHNRLPGYLKRAVGTVVKHYGAFRDPSDSAHRGVQTPNHLYAVRFSHSEVFGKIPSEVGETFLYADLFETYLAPAQADSAGLSSSEGDKHE